MSSDLDIDCVLDGLDEQTIKAVCSGAMKREFISALSASIADCGGDETQLQPKMENILRAFRLTPWSEIKLVIIGQDPYPRDATGVAFGANKMKPSVREMFECIKKNCISSADHGKIGSLDEQCTLVNWAESGVLLINATLTTETGKSNVHEKHWRNYMRLLLKKLLARKSPVAFMLLGNFAREMVPDRLDTVSMKKLTKVTPDSDEEDKLPMFKPAHKIAGFARFYCGHPSPQSTVNQDHSNSYAFRNSRIFTSANNWLIENDFEPIEWIQSRSGNPICTVGLKSRDDDDNVGSNDDTTDGANANTRVEYDKIDDSDDDSDDASAKLLAKMRAKKNKLANAIAEAKVKDKKKVTEVMAEAVAEALAEETSKNSPMSILVKNAQGNEFSSIIPSDTIFIFTDGGATGNGKADCDASWAFYAVGTNFTHKECGKVALNTCDIKLPATNNRGEATAILRAFEWIIHGCPGVENKLKSTKKTKSNKDTSSLSNLKIKLYTDSDLLLRTITSYMPKWISSDSSRGKANLDILFPIYGNYLGLKAMGVSVEFSHVNSHTPKPKDTARPLEKLIWYGNDTVDRLCSSVLQ